jgi:hypothetical protein
MDIFRASLAQLLLAPAPILGYPLSFFLVSLTTPEPEKLVFWAPPAPAPVCYSDATVEEPEPVRALPKRLLDKVTSEPHGR